MKGVEIREDRMRGEPTIEGTRIPTWRIAAWATSGLHERAIAEMYRLTVEQVGDALAFEKGR